ncbi:MAG: hypothetical protein O3C21_15105 [Verrucomicrobia bacterium]|nr:hypothetical protein [Verrucomicrobiota bacterium]
MTNRESIPKYLRLLTAVAIAGGLLFGCVSAQLTHLDPSFTPTALKDGALAIGGVAVTNGAEEITEREDASIVDYFEREMKARRPEIAIVKHSVIKTTLGEQASKMLPAAAMEEEIAPESMTALVGKGARYVAFVAVTYNTVDRYVTNNTDSRNVYDDNGKVTGRSTKYVTIAQAKRSVTAEYRIFDVMTGKRVWASNSSNSRSSSRIADSREGYPPAPEYGAPPTVSRVLRAMTTAAVKGLPAPEKETPQPVLPNIKTDPDP